MWPKVDWSLGRRVVWIGGLHGVAFVYGLLYAIMNIIEEERPITEGDIFYMCVHLLGHGFLITTLIIGAKMGNPILVLPWLIVSFPVFASVSYYTLKYTRYSYLSQLIFNIFFICLSWGIWLTVFQFLKSCKDANQKPEKT